MEAVAKALTERLIRYFGLPEHRRDMLGFGLVTLLISAVDLGAVVLAGWLARVLRLTLVAALTSALFRALTGGAHFSNPWTCAVASAAIAAALGRIAAVFSTLAPVWTGALLVLSLTAAGWAFWVHAPVASPAKPLSPSHQAKLRRITWAVGAIWAAAAGAALRFGEPGAVAASALGLLWQAYTLTPGGASFYRFVDTQVAKVRKRDYAKE
ncbi:MAG TPA: accessory gene regulator B family protein [Firmicutes bacterium]|nr:accessory gene regulator B family protein [Bacillota bacterium]